MKRRDGETGFTMIEVGLALAIGIIIAAASTVFYYQVKDNAGDAGMRQRIASLQSVVENVYSANGTCPDLGAVQQAWKAKRPQDYMTSPWGGQVNDATTLPAPGPYSTQGVRAGVGGGDRATETGNPASDWVLTNMGPGGLWFYRITAGGVPSMIATAGVYDVTLAKYVTVTGYAVAGNKHSNAKHFMVTSGR